VISKGSPTDLLELAKEDAKVDLLHQEIISYMGKISGNELSENEATELANMFEITNALETIGDIIETDMVGLGRQRIKQQLYISPQTKIVLDGIHKMVGQSLELVASSLSFDTRDDTAKIIEMKSKFNRLIESAHLHQMGRLTADESKRLQTYSLEVEIIEKLKRIYYFTKRIAKAAS